MISDLFNFFLIREILINRFVEMPLEFGSYYNSYFEYLGYYTMLIKYYHFVVYNIINYIYIILFNYVIVHFYIQEIIYAINSYSNLYSELLSTCSIAITQIYYGFKNPNDLNIKLYQNDYLLNCI